jgi:hypothetical protein
MIMFKHDSYGPPAPPSTSQVPGRFRARFLNRHVVLPVIHASTLDQVLRNVEVAVKAGADGVFLVNHGGPYLEIMNFRSDIRDRFDPGLWVGLNCLELQPTWVTTYPEADGMWSDNAYVDERRDEQPQAQRVLDIIRQPLDIPLADPHVEGWRGIYFGGVAFKYQRKVRPDTYGVAARKASAYMDVVTTSGAGTGEAADLEKVRAMREALGTFPLAVASGITPGNVGEFLPYVDCFLVATGISSDFENLDPELTRRLVEVVRQA